MHPRHFCNLCLGAFSTHWDLTSMQQYVTEQLVIFSITSDGRFRAVFHLFLQSSLLILILLHLQGNFQYFLPLMQKTKSMIFSFLCFISFILSLLLVLLFSLSTPKVLMLLRDKTFFTLAMSLSLDYSKLIFSILSLFSIVPDKKHVPLSSMFLYQSSLKITDCKIYFCQKQFKFKNHLCALAAKQDGISTQIHYLCNPDNGNNRNEKMGP